MIQTLGKTRTTSSRHGCAMPRRRSSTLCGESINSWDTWSNLNETGRPPRQDSPLVIREHSISRRCLSTSLIESCNLYATVNVFSTWAKWRFTKLVIKDTLSGMVECLYCSLYRTCKRTCTKSFKNAHTTLFIQVQNPSIATPNRGCRHYAFV
jgi:hypothetical protein